MPLLLLILLIVQINPTKALENNYFNTKYQMEIIDLEENNLTMLVKKSKKNNKNTLPPGTKLSGHIIKHGERKHFMHDEFYKIKLDLAVLPQGESKKLNAEIKISPRLLLSKQNLSTAVLVSTGGILGLTIDLLSVGLPVLRGGKALLDAGFAIYNSPKNKSKVKAGSIAFVRGALFPLPELILKGEALNLHKGSNIEVLSDNDQTLKAHLIKKLN